MVEKKVTKKTATKAAGKKAAKTENKDIKNLPISAQITLKRADLLNARKGLYDNTLQNPHIIKAIKKDIARLLTAQRKEQQEKGAK